MANNISILQGEKVRMLAEKMRSQRIFSRNRALMEFMRDGKFDKMSQETYNIAVS